MLGWVRKIGDCPHYFPLFHYFVPIISIISHYLKLEAGFGLSFEPILDVMSFNVGFPLFTIDKSGVKWGWGTPVWKWGKDE